MFTPGMSAAAVYIRDLLNEQLGSEWGGADTVQMLCDWMVANGVDPDGGDFGGEGNDHE